MALTLAAAQRIIANGLETAERMGVNVSVTVVDAGGYVVACARMDKASLLTADLAHGKATASALFKRTSAELAQSFPPGHAISQAASARLGGRFVASQGAVPLREGDQVIGAVGVSGAKAAEDEEIAMAAAEALQVPA